MGEPGLRLKLEGERLAIEDGSVKGREIDSVDAVISCRKEPYKQELAWYTATKKCIRGTNFDSQEGYKYCFWCPQAAIVVDLLLETVDFFATPVNAAAI